MVLINIKIIPQKRLFGRVFFFVDIFDCKNWYDFVFSLINEITFFRLKQKKVFYVPEKKFFLGNYIFLIQFYILLKVIKKNKVFFYFLSKKQNRTRSTQYVIYNLNGQIQEKPIRLRFRSRFVSYLHHHPFSRARANRSNFYETSQIFLVLFNI